MVKTPPPIAGLSAIGANLRKEGAPGKNRKQYLGIANHAASMANDKGMHQDHKRMAQDAGALETQKLNPESI